ncbi:hypothetical protein [Modestobacter sp. VKM Ac-2985]|uniref:hypothetical protein n=1 Tax=Modestobacter sp. VKM Ac-2985 TaxID=3004139 RepID=UPI0022AB9922|nr:hypothetical protein [Modestobacter sp. VKM Ac-2985]MCZ2837151.1 hypothetical protein [Modestobacter sp. VKM Ac-2985]
MTAAWPDPNATPLDRARAVARTYRDALVKANPQQAELFDSAARRVGEAWVCGVDTGERVCTVPEAALLLAVTEGRVRQLVGKDIPSAGRTSTGHVLLVADVLAYQARRRPGGRAGASALSSAASGGSVSAPRPAPSRERPC